MPLNESEAVKLRLDTTSPRGPVSVHTTFPLALSESKYARVAPASVKA